LPELTPLRRYLCSRAALLDIFETVCAGISGKTSGNKGPVAQMGVRTHRHKMMAEKRASCEHGKALLRELESLDRLIESPTAVTQW
jgi:hypothetical protein